jgi:hypothetical protein
MNSHAPNNGYLGDLYRDPCGVQAVAEPMWRLNAAHDAAHSSPREWVPLPPSWVPERLMPSKPLGDDGAAKLLAKRRAERPVSLATISPTARRSTGADGTPRTTTNHKENSMAPESLAVLDEIFRDDPVPDYRELHGQVSECRPEAPRKHSIAETLKLAAGPFACYKYEEKEKRPIAKQHKTEGKYAVIAPMLLAGKSTLAEITAALLAAYPNHDAAKAKATVRNCRYSLRCEGKTAGWLGETPVLESPTTSAPASTAAPRGPSKCSFINELLLKRTMGLQEMVAATVAAYPDADPKRTYNTIRACRSALQKKGLLPHVRGILPPPVAQPAPTVAATTQAV